PLDVLIGEYVWPQADAAQGASIGSYPFDEGSIFLYPPCRRVQRMRERFATFAQNAVLTAENLECEGFIHDAGGNAGIEFSQRKLLLQVRIAGDSPADAQAWNTMALG